MSLLQRELSRAFIAGKRKRGIGASRQLPRGRIVDDIGGERMKRDEKVPKGVSRCPLPKERGGGKTEPPTGKASKTAIFLRNQTFWFPPRRGLGMEKDLAIGKKRRRRSPEGRRKSGGGITYGYRSSWKHFKEGA